MHLRLAVALAAVAVGGCKGEAEPAEGARPIRVHCAAVEQRKLGEVRLVRGTVTAPPERSAIVSSEVAGRIAQVLVREGDVIVAGAIVAKVEPRSFSDALYESSAQVESARAAREVASTTLAREERMLKEGLTSQQAVENAKAALQQADASWKAARSRVDVAQHNVDRTVVHAPLSGVVTRVMSRAGEVVDGTAANPILEIADTGTMELAASAGAGDLLALRAGQSATVMFRELPGQPFGATVRTVAPALDKMGVGTVRLTLHAAPEAHLPLGLFGTAEIAIGEVHEALVVPARAVRNRGGDKTELVACEDGHAKIREVVTGIRRDGVVELQKGAAVGLRVVDRDVIGLADGVAIEEEQGEEKEAGREGDVESAP